jgi:hypothetical protein
MVLVLLAFGAAMGVSATAHHVAQSLDVDPVYVAPGVLGYLSPVLFAAFVFVLGNWMLRGHWTTRRALLFYIWLLAFTVANVINRCSPGWCETIGLPLPWRAWSDAMITINEDNVSAAMAGVGAVVGGVVNLLTFAAVAGVLTRGGARVPVSDVAKAAIRRLTKEP